MGCRHGSCKRAMECICDEGWKGSLCEEPICNDHCVMPYGTCGVSFLNFRDYDLPLIISVQSLNTNISIATWSVYMSNWMGGTKL